jgi:hypothetical protein
MYVVLYIKYLQVILLTIHCNKMHVHNCCAKIAEEMLAPYTDMSQAHIILKVCETTVLPWMMLWASWRFQCGVHTYSHVSLNNGDTFLEMHH